MNNKEGMSKGYRDEKGEKMKNGYVKKPKNKI